jgi:hypothetical protein
LEGWKMLEVRRFNITEPVIQSTLIIPFHFAEGFQKVVVSTFTGNLEFNIFNMQHISCEPHLGVEVGADGRLHAHHAADVGAPSESRDQTPRPRPQPTGTGLGLSQW